MEVSITGVCVHHLYAMIIKLRTFTGTLFNFFSFEASNGIKQQNSGFLKRVLVPQTREDGTDTGEKVEGDIVVQTGSYSFTGKYWKSIRFDRTNSTLFLDQYTS